MKEFKKIPLFDVFCEYCVNKDTPETEDPCNDCLQSEAKEDSHKPMFYKRNDDNVK